MKSECYSVSPTTYSPVGRWYSERLSNTSFHTKKQIESLFGITKIQIDSPHIILPKKLTDDQIRILEEEGGVSLVYCGDYSKHVIKEIVVAEYNQLTAKIADLKTRMYRDENFDMAIDVYEEFKEGLERLIDEYRK